jgi:tRNA-2-methylthio-N6-dimethylallyladenosine synthase
MLYNPSVSPERTVYLETFGCQMNKLDSELALQALAGAGFKQTESMHEADLIVFNTCSVREHAEERVRSRLGLLDPKHRGVTKHRKPGSIVAVMGCMAQREGGDLLGRAAGVDLVVGTKQFVELPRLYQEALRSRSREVATDLAEEFRYTRDVRYRSERHRAYVSIMRGCDLRCTFCIVPATRGPEESRPLEDILSEARALAEDGVLEITLLGQTVNSWGKQIPGSPDLADLLARLDEVPGLERVRFLTSHPSFFRNRFFERVRGLRTFMPYVHVPAQSGSNRVLKRMKRLYNVQDYLRMVDEMRAALPQVAIASDWIVGFPGETEDDYRASEDLLRRVRFSQSFVFKYSPRPGTPATRLPDDVPEDEKARRCTALLAVQEEISLAENRARVGSAQSVLVDGASKTNPDRLSGRTPDNRIVVFDSDGGGRLAGTLVTVDITGASANTLYGARSAARQGRRLPIVR